MAASMTGYPAMTASMTKQNVLFLCWQACEPSIASLWFVSDHPIGRGAKICRWSELSCGFPFVERDVGWSLGPMKLCLLRKDDDEDDDRLLAHCNGATSSQHN